MNNSKEFATRQEAKEFVAEFEKARIAINYRISPNYPLILVGRKLKADKTQAPKSYTLTFVS
jgi:hypothetical protein